MLLATIFLSATTKSTSIVNFCATWRQKATTSKRGSQQQRPQALFSLRPLQTAQTSARKSVTPPLQHPLEFPPGNSALVVNDIVVTPIQIPQQAHGQKQASRQPHLHSECRNVFLHLPPCPLLLFPPPLRPKFDSPQNATNHNSNNNNNSNNRSNSDDAANTLYRHERQKRGIMVLTLNIHKLKVGQEEN